MDSTQDEINDAIKNGTLDGIRSFAELHKRRQTFETQLELLPDIHHRGRLAFDTAIDVNVPESIKAGVPVVSVLQRVLDAIGALYDENTRRNAESVPERESTTEHESLVKDATPSQRPDYQNEQPREHSYEMEEVIESSELLDYDEPDSAEEQLYESESDYGKPSKGKGKLKRGRKKTKDIEAARIAIAVEARQKRMRLTHGTPNSDAKNPKRHLFGLNSELGDTSATLSPTPSSPTAKSGKLQNTVAASSHPRASSRLSRQAESTPSKPSADLPSPTPDNVNPTNLPSLIVKLKTRKPSTPNPVHVSIPNFHPKRGRPRNPEEKSKRKSKGKYKSGEFVDSDDEGEEMENDAPTDIAQETMRKTRKAAVKPAAKAMSKLKTLVFGRKEEETVNGDKNADVEMADPEPISRNGTTRETRQTRSGMTTRGKQPTNLSKAKQDARKPKPPAPSVRKMREKAPVAPRPKRNTTTRPRRGAMSSPFELFEPPPAETAMPAEENVFSDTWSDTAVIPNSPSPPLIADSPDSRPKSPSSSSKDDTPSIASPTTPIPLAPQTFAPFPPLTPRDLTPFTRGARIALENILSDHQSEPLTSLIDLIEELDDTRPIVNDWEHVTVMKGGCWVYQVMRDVWEEVVDESDEEEMEVDVNIEEVVGRVGGWVDKEVERLGGNEEGE
ncbi:uncharacterized protein J4E84_004909 [Alternaria hordeiaustralica]|uniref:uncharacterized protein n=1 Tax=Alternaria hordeiaustralica TaxID=1187925 RepID=UPI0020C24FF8|nr:uncharacterized protein J4E84_004909 [Alternaria hordeiaustralica]KAI4687981.1 hypothetical protein J4E84_004909 [Alternaria hordeiaustralica]